MIVDFIDVKKKLVNILTIKLMTDIRQETRIFNLIKLSS